MSKYVISYDVSDSENNQETYVKVPSSLKNLGGYRVTKNVWLIESSKSSDELVGLIRNCIKKDDTILVVRISEEPKFYNQKKFED